MGFKLIDIKQVNNHDCPNCKTQIEPYGQVTIPPITVQTLDELLTVTRGWIADRHHCPKCDEIFDMIIINIAKGSR